MQKLIISPSPHIFAGISTRRLMRDVLIALIPTLIVSFWFFGYRAIILTTVCVVASIITEWLLQKYALKIKPTISDFSATITGVLLALNLPPALPLYMAIIGSVFAIAIVKISFGGLGCNLFNPAMAGRVFLLIAFPAAMTTWTLPVDSFFSTDAVTGATPLGLLNDGLWKKLTPDQIMQNNELTYGRLLLGNIGGSFGEVSAIALLIGFVYLLIRKVITWHIPIVIFATTALFTGILWMINPNIYANPLFHLLSGGLILGAVFMATDYVTSPMSKKGMVIYAMGIAIITCVIRIWGSYPEGVSFAILIMNALTPLINNYFKPRKFGEKAHG